MKSADYIDAIKARHQLPSDYAVAKLLGVRPQRVQKYRYGQAEMGEEMLLKVAELLELNPLEVLTNIQAARAKDPAQRRIWARLAKQVRGLAPSTAAVLLSASLAAGSLAPSPAQASQIPESNGYYVK